MDNVIIETLNAVVLYCIQSGNNTGVYVYTRILSRYVIEGINDIEYDNWLMNNPDIAL